MMENWDGMSMQRALLECEIVFETSIADRGVGPEILFPKTRP